MLSPMLYSTVLTILGMIFTFSFSKSSASFSESVLGQAEAPSRLQLQAAALNKANFNVDL